MPPSSNTLSDSPVTGMPALDTRHHVETPEGIDLVLRPASAIPRILAFLLDLLLRGAILLLAFIVLALLGGFGKGMVSIVVFLVSWWYMVLFEVLNQGRSPGKQIMGLRVVHDDGTPVGWGASLTRNLLRFVDMLPFAYCLGLISCLSHPAFKRLGDLAAGTLVVYRDDTPKRPPIPEGDVERAPFPLNLDEQRALLGFVERQAGLSSARRSEVASILAEPLQVPAEQAEGKINAIARGLMGAT
ncbi:RDD family protein [Pseudomonas sp. LRF_L74]|uniref:RDD family protein n=1 Tax=Pseudomonas sp. LRF_L74 TaxID=3369422 RepID=UPI003F5EE39C